MHSCYYSNPIKQTTENVTRNISKRQERNKVAMKALLQMFFMTIFMVYYQVIIWSCPGITAIDTTNDRSKVRYVDIPMILKLSAVIYSSCTSNGYV